MFVLGSIGRHAWLCDREPRAHLGPGVVREVDHDRRWRAPDDHPLKRLRLRRVDFHVQREGRHMDEVAGFCAGGEFSLGAPTDFSYARQDISDRLLLTMMMNAGTRARCHREQATPSVRFNADLWGDRGQTLRPGVCAIPWLKSSGRMMLIGEYERATSLPRGLWFPVRVKRAVCS